MHWRSGKQRLSKSSNSSTTAHHAVHCTAMEPGAVVAAMWERRRWQRWCIDLMLLLLLPDTMEQGIIQRYTNGVHQRNESRENVVVVEVGLVLGRHQREGSVAVLADIIPAKDNAACDEVVVVVVVLRAVQVVV